MKNIIDSLAQKGGLLEGMSSDLLSILFIFVIAAILLGFISLFAGVTSIVERKIAGRMQSRIGPNKVWFRGFFQFLADGVKSFEKEDIVPDLADKPLFLIAPYIVFAGMFGTLVVLPFGSTLISADLNIGIVYLFAIASFNVIGILMAGWASNNKWSLIGGIRAVAQIVSYEIPTSLAALSVILLVGSLSMQSIIQSQGAMPWQWNLTNNPFTCVAFFILFITLLAEGNRVPFDIPEAESELVSGYNTEYSGLRFLLFFFAEWANIYVMSAIITTLFLGGWQSPWNMSIILFEHSIEITGVILFFAKSLVITFVIIWVRWTLPRLRVDQLMIACWKYFIPISLFNLLGILVWMVVFPKGSMTVSLVISLLLAMVFVYFLYKVIYVNLIRMKAEIGL